MNASDVGPAAVDWSRSAFELAPTLLGRTLSVGDRAGRIVEVEAYGAEDDPASHSYRGETPRNRVMFGPPGRLYVYRIYGMHWCANVACGPEGVATALLVRALAPTEGLAAMFGARPKASKPTDLCSGPGKLCAALGIDGSHDGVSLFDDDSPVRLSGDANVERVVTGPRIGISKAVERPWRFAIAGDPNVSRPRPPGWSERSR